MADPTPITRDGAAHSAHQILQGPQYRAAQPSLLQRIVTRATNDLTRALGRASDAVGGPVVLIILIALVVVVIVLIRVKLGKAPIAAIFSGRGGKATRRSASDYRDEAAGFTRAGHYDEAVRATTRAMVRELEDRGVLEPTPGSTAAALSTQAARAVPAVGDDAALIAGVFDEVWYSGRTASSSDAEQTAAAELRVSRQRLRVAELITAEP